MKWCSCGSWGWQGALRGLFLRGLVLVLFAVAYPAQDAAPFRAFRMRIEGPLDRSTQSHLRRAIERAAAADGYLIIDLDTPGGEVELMWQMARMIQDASLRGVTTVVWVNEKALSAGSLLALASDRLFMRAQGRIGSALPVRSGPTGIMPVSEDENVVEKILSEYRTEFRTIAESRNRSGALAEAMVDPGVEVVEVEIDGVPELMTAGELRDLRSEGRQPPFLRTVVHEGKIFNVNGKEAVDLRLADNVAETLDQVALLLSLRSEEIETIERARSEEVAGVLYTWTPLFLMLAFVLAYVELKIPGFGVAGILSIVCFSIVLFGRYLVGMADVPHVILLVLGVGLLAAEIFLVPGTIWLGALGAVSLIAGLIWSFAGIGTGFAFALDREILLNETLRIMAVAFVSMIATWSLSRFLPQTPIFGRLVLQAGRDASAEDFLLPEASGAHARVAHVGARGRAVTALRPVGKVVLVDDETIDFEARSSGPEIPPGSAVVVVETTGAGRLVVELAEASSNESDGGQRA